MVMNETTYTPGQLSRLLGVTTNTLIEWEKTGKLKSAKTNGGHRRYIYERIKCEEDIQEKGKKNIIYARVSSSKQRSDLERQIATLQQRYPKHEVIQDIGSGINFKRRGLRSLLDQVFEGNVSEVVVAHRDRLSRFGFELFIDIFKRFGVRIQVVGSEDVQEPSEVLVNDILSIITVFTARYYGSRKYNLLSKDQDLPKPGTKKAVQKVSRGIKIRFQQVDRNPKREGESKGAAKVKRIETSSNEV